MNEDGLNTADAQEYERWIREARSELRRRRKARRYAFWASLADLLLSMPPGIGVRLGG
ncbi:hypothetical protein ACH3VR_04645 [Microbacterium sp. B2969]|uniref:Uncharacterized protein n=1 Tax=Microbacterium alkaliflavum TaxID=3248839 RepID=A0ABW7Q466_9MICO